MKEFRLIPAQDKVIRRLAEVHVGYRWRTLRAFKRELLRQGYPVEQTYAICIDTMDIFNLAQRCSLVQKIKE